MTQHAEVTPESEARAKAILERLRPYLQSDGGDLEYLRIEENVLYIRLQGACSGCASSLVTLKAGIERQIVEECPGILAVEAEMA